eukprot:6546655-Prymnesium_polylepis.1
MRPGGWDGRRGTRERRAAAAMQRAEAGKRGRCDGRMRRAAPSDASGETRAIQRAAAAARRAAKGSDATNPEGGGAARRGRTHLLLRAQHGAHVCEELAGECGRG